MLAPVRALLVLTATLASGCIVIPAALPPAKAAIGIAPAIGNPLPADDGTPYSEAEGMFLGRIGITPQAMWPEQNLRIFEVEAGYTFHVFAEENWQQRNRHGGFLGLSILAGHFWLGENWRARIVFRGAGEILALQGLPGWGGGGSWGVGVEIARFVSVDGESGGPIQLLGWAAGELSVGGEIFGGVYSVAGADYGVVGFAITGRWPGIFGVGVIPLAGSF
jgi:hypothetical protein